LIVNVTLTIMTIKQSHPSR